jgi:hypothetical protein
MYYELMLLKIIAIKLTKAMSNFANGSTILKK